ncbi:MAG TPA: hypothetical protein VF297_20590 [Pyrinomonadaceae bacterium]
MPKENSRRAHVPLLTAALLLVALAATAPAARAQAQADEWIKLLAGPTYEMLEDGEQVPLRVPVTLAEDVQPGEVRLRRLYVRLGQRHNRSLLGAFSVQETLGNDAKDGPAIELVAHMPDASAQGTYELLIEATHAKEGTQKKPRLLTVQIFHPAAKLGTTGTLVVERVVGFFREPSVEGATLQLRESAGQSRLVVNALEPVRFFNAANGETKGSLSFTGLPLNLAPRGGGTVSYNLNGEFHPGTTKGTALINSPQLAEPVPVNFEVRTRFARWYIVAVIVLGLLAGYFLRTWLKERVALNESRLKAYDRLEQLKLAFDKNKDPGFRESVTQHVNLVGNAAAGSDQNVIKQAVDNAGTALQDALTRLEQAKAAAKTSQAEAATLLRNFNTWSLPDDIKAARTPAVASLDAAGAALGVNNVSEAKRHLTELVATLAESVRQPVLNWKNEVAVRLEILGGEEVPLPARIAGSLKQGVEQLRASLSKVTAMPPGSGVAELSSNMQAVSDVRENIAPLVRRMDTWLGSEFDELKQTLEAIPDTGPPSVQALSSAVEAFRREIADASRTPEALLQLLTRARLAALDEAWQTSVLEQLKEEELKKEPGTEVLKLIDERQYVEAARVARQIVRTRRSTALGSATGAAQTARPGLGQFVPHSSAAATDSATYEPGEQVVQLVRVGRARTFRELLAANLLQTILLGLLIALGGYLLFQEKFVGTFPDFAAVFFWAFGLDVTLDKFLEVSQTIKKPTS